MPIHYILAAVAIAVAAASDDSSQGTALRGATAADLAEPRRVQEVQVQQPVNQPVNQAPLPPNQGGTVQGGTMPWHGDATAQLPELPPPFDKLEHIFTTKAYLSRFVILMIVGFFYWCCIVTKYPKLVEPSMTSARLQSENELNATCQTSFVNCLYSYLCSQSRAAHTFDSAGVCGYWPSLILMTLFPCPTLFLMNSCSNLNEKLGGRKKDCCSGLICSFCCSCCVIAQDAESLDMATGARTHCCGVEQAPDFHHGMYPGGGMPPQHHMHHVHHGHHGYAPQQQGGFMVQPQASGSYGYGQGYPMQQY